MNIRMAQEVLTKHIKTFGSQAIEARQVAQRLRILLPRRLFQLKRSYQQNPYSASQAMRLALRDQKYEQHVNELLKISADALVSRIQFETHMMLFQARRSLKKRQWR